MNNVFDFTVFCENILFLRRFTGMGRIRFARLLGINRTALKAIEEKQGFAHIDIIILSRLRLLLGESARDIFFRRFE